MSSLLADDIAAPEPPDVEADVGDIAQAILDGFDLHYWLFREYCGRAGEYFARGEWAAAFAVNRARIDMYDARVAETVATVLTLFPRAASDEKIWMRVKRAYLGLLHDHLQPECAETFYNSVACRVIDRAYYNNQYIFWRPGMSTEHLEGDDPTYRCYYPAQGVLRTLRQILADLPLHQPLGRPRRDLRCLARALRRAFPRPRPPAPGERPSENLQVHVLASLFFRNQAAYVLGRVIDGGSERPFAVPIRRSAEGELYLDALLTDPGHLITLFSLARAYFMVDMEVPSAYVAFLQSLMPDKPRAELYTAVGLQKQGKTLLYRDLQLHLRHSTDRFCLAPGTKGMVMVVFTLPSFPYVFKIIRDRFDPPKDTTPERVKDRYLLVKHHDRVGRMADTLEYSNVALPLRRFDPAVIDELRRLALSQIEVNGEHLVVSHVYIERRLIPLDLYLRGADEARLRIGVQGFGDALRDLAEANIFAGDLLPKNFGVTRLGRVVFYDYDEICYLTECRFRRMPEARCDEDEYRAEPFFSVGAGDVFPEEFPTFLFPPGPARELFLRLHGDLCEPAFWQGAQERVRAGALSEVFPYPQELRFRNTCPGLAR